MTPEAFIAKWRANTRPESSAYAEHFTDLCRLLSHAKHGTAFCPNLDCARRHDRG